MIANDVVDLLQSMTITDVDPKNIFAYGIPKGVFANGSLTESTDKIVILVTEISRAPNEYGSDYPISNVATIQVQFFYPTTYQKDAVTEIEDPVLLFLRKNGWFQTIGGGVDRTPDTEQLYTTYHFQKENLINY